MCNTHQEILDRDKYIDLINHDNARLQEQLDAYNDIIDNQDKQIAHLTKLLEQQTQKIVVQDNWGCTETLKQLLPKSRFADIRVRYDGNWYWFDASFLKQAFEHIEVSIREPLDKCEGHHEHIQVDDK